MRQMVDGASLAAINNKIVKNVLWQGSYFTNHFESPDFKIKSRRNKQEFEHSVDSIWCCTGFRNVTPSGNTCANLFGGTSSLSTVYTAVTYILTESQVPVLIV